MLTLKQDTMLGNVPSDWVRKPLRSLLSADFPGDWGDDRGPYMSKVLRSTNLTNEGRLNLADIALRALPKKKVDVLMPKAHDILLERSGGGPGQPVGRVGFVPTDLQEHGFSNFLHLLRPNTGEIDPRFLAWVLYQVNRSGRIIRLEQQTTQMRNLHFRDYLTMLLPVPPPGEQTAIARILDAVDTALECNRAAVEKARVLRRSMIHALLSRGVRNEKLRRAAVGLIASNWKCEALGKHIADGPDNGVYRPESDYAEHGTRIVRIDDFSDGRIRELSSLRRVVVEPIIQRRYALSTDDVVINRVNSLSHIGKAALVPALGEPIIFESNMMRLRCGPLLLPSFLIVVLCSDIARRHWLARAKPAVNQASVNQRDVREMPLPLPEIDEQKEIVCLISAADRSIERLIDVCDAQQRLKKSLMHDLLTGRVRVKSAVEALAA